MELSDMGIDHRLVKAMGHPLRLRLLALLSERVASPSELAEELGEPLGNVSYHVRTLADFGCIELVDTTPRRGALEHHYRAVVRPFFSDRDWAQLPSPVRRSISDGVLAQIWRDAAEAAEAGSFDSREDRHLSRTNLVLDDVGWRELGELLTQVIERAFEIQAESAARLQTEGAERPPVTSKLAMMHYEMASSESPKPRARQTGNRGSKARGTRSRSR